MSKIRILIDANIYLDLYGSRELKVLLAGLGTLEGLFVSKQLADEVARNRLRVAHRAFASQSATLDNIAALALPDEVIADFGDELAHVIRDFNRAAKEAKALKKKLAASMGEALRKITEGSDQITVALDKLFRHAEEATDEQLRRARLRRERGSPPGKPSDPLGDQITWEQFLSRCAGASRIFIVTRDGDYGSVWGGRCFLNPFLHSEIKAVAPTAAVAMFDKLSEVLPVLKKAIGAGVAVPNAEKLKKAKRAEETAAMHAKLSNALGREAALSAGLSDLAAGQSDPFRTMYPSILGDLAKQSEQFKRVYPSMLGDFARQAEQFRNVYPSILGDFAKQAEQFKSVYPSILGDFAKQAEQFKSVYPSILSDFAKHAEQFKSVYPSMLSDFAKQAEQFKSVYPSIFGDSAKQAGQLHAGSPTPAPDAASEQSDATRLSSESAPESSNPGRPADR